MFLPISKPIWENTPLLNSFIGQTRLLTPMSIITASIFAITLQKKRNLQFLIIISYLIVASTMLNWANRRMRETPTNPIAQDIEIYTEYYNEDDTKYHKRYLERLPLVHEIIQQRPLLNIDFVSGTGSAYEMYRAQTKHIYNVKVITKEAKIRENTLYFPGWTVKANGNPIKIDHEDKTKDNFGKITFSLSKGQYITVVEFSDTPVRFISKIISLISILAGLTIFIYLKIFHPKKPSKLRID